jgi:hypothetical protein
MCVFLTISHKKCCVIRKEAEMLGKIIKLYLLKLFLELSVKAL